MHVRARKRGVNEVSAASMLSNVCTVRVYMCVWSQVQAVYDNKLMFLDNMYAVKPLQLTMLLIMFDQIYITFFIYILY